MKNKNERKRAQLNVLRMFDFVPPSFKRLPPTPVFTFSSWYFRFNADGFRWNKTATNIPLCVIFICFCFFFISLWSFILSIDSFFFFGRQSRLAQNIPDGRQRKDFLFDYLYTVPWAPSFTYTLVDCRGILHHILFLSTSHSIKQFNKSPSVYNTLHKIK